MADAKITALTAGTEVDQDELLAYVEDPSGSAVTKKITKEDLLTPLWFFAEKTSQQAMTTSLSDVTGWATPDNVDAGAFSFNATTGVLTINKTGLYMVGYKLMFNLASGTRVHGYAQLHLDTGGGYAAVAGMATAGYGRTVDEGSTGSAQRVIALTTGDTLKIQAIEIGGALEINDPTYADSNFWAHLIA